MLEPYHDWYDHVLKAREEARQAAARFESLMRATQDLTHRDLLQQVIAEYFIASELQSLSAEEFAQLAYEYVRE